MSSLPSTLRRTQLDELRLVKSNFVRFWIAVGLAAAVAMPFVLSNHWTGIANQTLIALVGALALNLLMGITGQISLGHAGFVAAGAFTVAALVTHLDAPMIVTVPAAAITGGLLGVLVGVPALRLKGLYLAVSTLAAHFVITVGLAQYQASVTYGAGFTIQPPAIGSHAISSERQWSFILLPIALLVLILNVNLLRSAYGRAWVAIRHRDIAAESLGINVARYKLLAFSLSTAMTSCAGALSAYHTGFVSIEAFDFHLLIQYLAIVIIGGLGSVTGTVLGTAFVMTLPHMLTAISERVPMIKGLGTQVFDLQVGAFGVIMLLFLILEPKGLGGIWSRVRSYFDLWPFKYRAWES